MQIRQTQKLTQRLSLTPIMKQSIHVLQLPILDLKDFLNAQLEENPVLAYDISSKPHKPPLSEEKIRKLLEVNDRSNANYNDYNSEQNTKDLQKKQDYQETLITSAPSLQDNLLYQLRLSQLKKTDFFIAEFLISHLDDNGYLQLSLEEITQLLNKEHRVIDKQLSVKEVEKVLFFIQTFEPAGIAARNLKECLLLQLNLKKNSSSLSQKIIKNHLVDVAKKRISYISKKLKRPIEEIQKSLEEIASLEPKPGRAFSQEQVVRIASIAPDILIHKIDSKWEIIINSRGLPPLRINNHYKKLLTAKDTTEEIKQYLRDKITSAQSLVKALSQREDTIKKLAKYIFQIQKDFFIRGDIAALKPLSYRKMAKLINRNESTVSRVVNNKYIQTPYGTFKLNFFFSKHLSTTEGGKISTEQIK